MQGIYGNTKKKDKNANSAQIKRLAAGRGTVDLILELKKIYKKSCEWNKEKYVKLKEEIRQTTWKEILGKLDSAEQ